MRSSKLMRGIAAIVVGVAMMAGGAWLAGWGVKTVREEVAAPAAGTVEAKDTVHKRLSELLFVQPMATTAREVGVWTITGRRGAQILWREVVHNSLSKIADQRMLELQVRGGAAPGASYYIGLADSTNPCSITKADSTATAWTGEPSGSGYARVAVSKDSTGWPTSAASSNDWHIVSKTVTFTSSGTIGPVNCAVLSDQSSGTAGDWHAWAALSAARTLASGESLDVSMDITLQ